MLNSYQQLLLKAELGYLLRSLLASKRRAIRLAAVEDEENLFDNDQWYDKDDEDDDKEKLAGDAGDLSTEFEEISQDPSQHKWYIEHDKEYQQWFEAKTAAEQRGSAGVSQSPLEALIESNMTLLNLPREQAEQLAIEQFKEEQSRRSISDDEDVPDDSGESEVESDNVKEAPAQKQKPTFVKTIEEYEELKYKITPSNKSLANHIANNDPVESRNLQRVFWGYAPPAVIREKYKVGTKQQTLNSVISARQAILEEWPTTARNYEKYSAYEGEDKVAFQQGLAKAFDAHDALTKLAKDIETEFGSHRFEVARIKADKKMRASLLAASREIEQGLTSLRDSIPRNADFGPNLLNLLDILVSCQIAFDSILTNPSDDEVVAESFLDWHNRFEKGDPAFDKLFRLILTYTRMLCLGHLRNPSVRNLPGVEGDVDSLVNAVLYGIGLKESESQSELLGVSRQYGEEDYDRFVNSPALYEQTLAKISDPVQRNKFVAKVDAHRHLRMSLNKSSSVLHQIHEYLTRVDSRSDATCPKCNSSWWSFQNTTANASSSFFNEIILPKLEKDPENVKSRLQSAHKGDLFHEWRNSPFKAPVGIYAPGEGEFCGGLFSDADIEEVRTTLAAFESVCANFKQTLQAEVESAMELQPQEVIQKVLKSPFQLVKSGDAFALEFAPNKTVQIALPTASLQEVVSNKNAFKEAIENLKPVPEFVYKRKVYVISKAQFAELQEKLANKLCFHPKKQAVHSLADVVRKGVAGAIKGLKYISKSSVKEQGVYWICPACNAKNREMVDIKVYERRKQNPIDLYCDNCGFVGSSQSQSDSKKLEGIPLRTESNRVTQSPNQSLDYRIDDDAGSIASTIAAPQEEDALEQQEKQQAISGRVEKIIQTVNQFGAQNAFVIRPTKSGGPGRVRQIEVKIPDLGSVFQSVFDVDNYQELLEARDSTLLPIAHKLGLILPFAFCNSCGTFHPNPVMEGAKATCIHVEKLGLSSSQPMNEVIVAYEKALASNSDFPKIHIPDFGEWKKLWSNTKEAKVKKLTRTAAVEDEFDPDLGDMLEEILAPEKAKEPTKEERVLPKEKSKDDDDLDILDALEDTEVADASVNNVVEEISKPTISEDPIDKGYSEILDESAIEDLTEKRGPIETTSMLEALRVLPLSKQQEVLGTNVSVYAGGTVGEKIPEDLQELLKRQYQIKNILVTADSPLEVVKEIFNTILKHLKEQQHLFER